MKPGEEMHSAVEEVDLDPCDLYLDLGSLIVEGRIPGLNDRGFGEGPHCPPTTAGAYTQQPPQCRHHCNPEAPECQRYEQIQKHMLLLWKNGIPMSIEVLLYPMCCTALAPSQSIDTSAMPDMSYVLLEQWTVHMLPRRVPDASIHPRGLLQAIRSFLYFSQLCAWFSLTGGKSPQNVHYRVCVPGEAFSSRFAATPEVHVFPIANVGRNAAMKVLVKSHPRCGEIPSMICKTHPTPIFFQKSVKQEVKFDPLEDESEEFRMGAEGEIIDGVLPTQPTSRTSSPADSMLGESLLDPPNSLCMYPKRYQSPSRCGSPSLEVPEHLMFGKGSITQRELQRQRISAETQNRSRSHQKPVIERILKKSLGESFCTSGEMHLERHKKYGYLNKALENDNPYANVDLTHYFCDDTDLTTVPKAEMETVLHRLRSRCLGTRSTQDKVQKPYLLSNPNKLELLDDTFSIDSDFNKSRNSTKLPQKYDESSIDAKSTERFYTSSKPNFNSHDKVHINLKSDVQKFSKSTKGKCRITSVHSKYLSEEHHDGSVQDQPNTSETDTNLFHYNKSLYRVQGSYPSAPFTHRTAINKNELNKSLTHTSRENDKNKTYHNVRDISEPQVPVSLAGVNIKKCGTLLQSITLSDKLIDERGVTNTHLSSLLLQKFSKPSSRDVTYDEFDPSNFAIPSAEEKAQFRRSLDSATSLVFHKKSGLPLTSSPAPIRKSGTCFDFDSSLTSVSAIKRALFEKEPEDEDAGKQQNLPMSISAPSSMTISSLLGTFEESVLNGRLEPVSTVEGFTAEIGASGSFCPRHITLPVTIFFYTLQDIDKVTSPYLGHINLGKKEYHVPKSGTIQVTLFNPHRTVVKMFVVRYDLTDMPSNCQTFLRQRTLYMPTDASENDPDAQKWLRYLIHLRFSSSKSGRIYLHTDVRMIIFRKSDLDAATVHGQRPYELRSFTQGPMNPKFSPRRP